MKRVTVLVLALLMLLSLVGCGANEELEAKQKELESELTDVKAQLDHKTAEAAALQTEVDTLKAQLDSAEEALGDKSVYALHATINGENIVTITEQTTLTAEAELPEGMVVDHWELDGQVQEETEKTFTFTSSESAVVAAVLRPEKKVTTVNCKLRFLNEDGKAEGDSYEEFVFEEPYKNPVTEEEIVDGTISVQVKAEIPSGYMVDYWKINGVEYHYGTALQSFVVKNLDEATEYEVVLKEIPVTYYKVTVHYGTINGKTELWVPAGTTLTAVCDSGFYAEFVINGVQQNDKWNDPYVKQWTFTVQGDTVVWCYAIIN